MPWLVWVKVYRVWSRMPAPRVDTELVELSYELVKREVQGEKVRRRTRDSSISVEAAETVEMAKWLYIWSARMNILQHFRCRIAHRASIKKSRGSVSS
jgi:hypothetical protein